jgi:hypothetical protein
MQGHYNHCPYEGIKDDPLQTTVMCSGTPIIGFQIY